VIDLLPTTTFARGYLVSHPPRYLGTLPGPALLAAGVDPVFPKAAHGIAIMQEGRLAAHAKSLEDARRKALLLNGNVTICEAVALTKNDTPVWRTLERIEWQPADELAEAAMLVDTSTGYLLEKAWKGGPVDYKRLAGMLASTMMSSERKVTAPLLEKHLKKEVGKLKNITPEAWKKAMDNVTKKVVDKLSVQKITDAWKPRMQVTLENTATGTKTALKDTFGIDLRTSLSMEESKAISTLTQHQGWHLKDNMGKRSAALTKKGLRIIENGMKQGLAQQTIARDLQKLPGLWDQYGVNYARAAASTAVNRARTYAEVTGYTEAGIELLEVQAVLDERTTDQCRYMDGKIIEVRKAEGNIYRAMSASPGTIQQAAPFLRTWREEGMQPGRYYIGPEGGSAIGMITRSGVGAADDRGEYKTFVPDSQLPEVANIGPPPYHHQCRSYTVPRMSSVAVPSGYSAQADPGPVTPPTKAPPKKPLPSVAKPKDAQPGLFPTTTPAKAKAKPTLSQRPLSLVKNPTEGSPTKIGKPTAKLKTPPPPKEVVRPPKTKPMKLPSLKAAHGKPGLAKELEQQYYKIPKSKKGPDLFKIADPIYKDPDVKEFVRQWEELSKKEFYSVTSDAELSKATRTTIDRVISTWDETSGDNSPNALLLQHAARLEFDLAKADVARLNMKLPMINRSFDEAAVRGARKTLRSMYNHTQEVLKEKGIKSVKVFRGMKYNKGRYNKALGAGQRFDGKYYSETISEQPLISTSHDGTTAMNFALDTSDYHRASKITFQEVPRERVFSLHSTGLGLADEYEVVVLGGTDTVSAAGISRSNLDAFIDSPVEKGAELGRLLAGE